MATTYFDAIDYLRQARDAGIPQAAAEVAHQEFNQRDLSTKQDVLLVKQELRQEIQVVKQELEITKQELRQEIQAVHIKIEQSKNSVLMWLFSMFTVYGGAMLGIMGHGFHWW